MKQLKLYKDSAQQILDIVHAARAMGLVQGKDFDFEYYPCHGLLEQKHVVFTLYDDKWASMFALRWS